jgi:prepilin-type N-terminal cleavage/methylation domain-containing protein
MHNFKAIKPAHGYTLVELMITAAVIAMLAAIAIPSYNGYIDTSKHAATLSNAEILQPLLIITFTKTALTWQAHMIRVVMYLPCPTL